jgi:hypothetical protein
VNAHRSLLRGTEQRSGKLLWSGRKVSGIKFTNPKEGEDNGVSVADRPWGRRLTTGRPSSREDGRVRENNGVVG